MDPLPSPLLDGPFTVRAAKALGVAEPRLRDPRLVIVTRGVRAHAKPTTLLERARSFQVAIPMECAVSHVTSARLWELPLPRCLEAQADIDIMCRTGSGPIRRPGCRGHRGLESREVSSIEGLPAVGLIDTWVDLGELLGRGLTADDLVVIGDVVAARLNKEASEDVAVAAMREVLNGRNRPRGKKILAETLPLVSPRSKSPMESRARLMFHRGGLPAPELNVSVRFDDESGSEGGGWMLEGDFVWRAQRVIGEYQGKHHKDIRQRAVDVARRHLAEDEGWTFVEIFAGDVYVRPKRISMLRRLARELGVPKADLNLA